MQVDLFDFELPAEFIATRPARPRDSARMLLVEPDRLLDAVVGDLSDYLRPGDLLVFNDARVMPAQLLGHKEDGRKIEITLHKCESESRWRAFAKPAKKLSAGEVLRFSDSLSAEVMEKIGGELELEFSSINNDILRDIEKSGDMPLPPYIRKMRDVDEQDREDYQTIYGRVDGAVAAPTAGLHFTSEMMQKLEAKGIGRCMVTLIVGAGTFLPVKVEDTREHEMHSEYGEVSAEVAKQINATKAAGGRVVAVGTTSLRLLESATDAEGITHAFADETDIFITPGYRFRCIDLLMTNFHLPKSTLFMLVSAFAGLERMQSAYAHAKAEGYRFYSYGDASLLFRENLPHD